MSINYIKLYYHKYDNNLDIYDYYITKNNMYMKHKIGLRNDQY